MRVNIYHPLFWTKQDYWSYNHHTPRSNGDWKGFTYNVNSKINYEADFIVIHEDIDEVMRFRGRSGCFCLVTGEEKSIVESYNQEYLNQFDIIITSRDDIKHQCVIPTHYLHPWWVKKTYDELISMNNPQKTKVMSSIISNLTVSPTHKKRFAFINQLKGHYKNNLDWFSKGDSTYLENKWDGLAQYEYSVVVENSFYNNYFTEKISDCFLAYTVPFYDGCPNIKQFFDDRSFVQIDMHDFLNSISVIDEAIRSNFYQKNLKFIKESRNLVLEKYHFLAALTEILKSVNCPKVTVSKTIKPHKYFRESKIERLRTVGKKIVRLAF